MADKYKVGEIVKTGINEKNKNKFIRINNGKEEFTPLFSPNNYPEIGDVINKCKVGDKVKYQANISKVNPQKPIHWLNYLEIIESVNEEPKQREPHKPQIEPTFDNQTQQTEISFKLVKLYYQLNNDDINKLQAPKDLDQLTNEVLNVKNKLFPKKLFPRGNDEE